MIDARFIGFTENHRKVYEGILRYRAGCASDCSVFLASVPGSDDDHILMLLGHRAPDEIEGRHMSLGEVPRHLGIDRTVVEDIEALAKMIAHRTAVGAAA